LKSPYRSLLIAFILVFVLSVQVFRPASSSAGENTDNLSWLEGFTLIELETDDVQSMHQARSLIEFYGGQIAILSPPSLLMGWVPYELRDELIGQANIKDIFFTDVLPGEVEIKDRQTQHMVTYYNRLIRGEYGEDFVRRQMAAPPVDPLRLRPDAKDRGQLEEREYRQNLEDNGFEVQNLKDRGILLERSTFDTAGNSDRMMGTVATSIIFVESDGSGSDPNTYTWTDQHVQDWIAGANTGMAWWSSRARNYNDCWVAFFVRYFPPTDSRCRNWREMVLHPSSDVAVVATDIMFKFGHQSGNHFTRVNSFNTAQRAKYGTDWAYTGFVAYNPPPAPDELTDGAAAFAYRGGPYTFLLYRSYGWAPEQVFAHESGHIFWACDEYSGGCSGTSCSSVCANGVVNGNCEECASTVPCMMLANSWALCSYTDDHVGWQISPCAPSPLTPPTAISSAPASGVQGGSYDITIAGTDFLYGAYAGFGADVTVMSNEVVGTDTLLISITIDNDAVPGLRNVTVYNRDMQSSTLADAFEVKASTRHYVSSTGGDVYPYITPSAAATTIGDALTAAADGDSLLVTSEVISLTSLIIDKGVTLSGAWTGGFTGRDVVGARTTIDLGNDIVIGSGAGEAVIEGFILQNGRGTAAIVPKPGDYGGAVKIVNSTAKLAQCEIRQNEATGGPGFGGGGAVFASGSTVTIEYCSIHDNTATVGGGVYLYDCSAVLTGNTIADNTVSASTEQPVGGGVAIEGSASAALTGNTIDGNTGSRNGGGVWIESTAAVTLSGGVVSHNPASSYGGGVYASKSEVDVEGVTFLRNVTSLLGGGIAFADTCDVVVNGCSFLWNTGLIGGGIYFSVGDCSVRHNLLVGNSASNAAGGLYAGTIAAGEITGNTLDRNSGAANGGGMLVADSAVEVFNNIVANSTGHGIVCTGAPPILMYNDVWNSSGDDYNGCTAGVGSISSDPVFADTASTDYHLGIHSPAIDAGRPGAAYDDPDGSPGDMGLYGSHAFVMDQPSYTKNLFAENGGGEVVLHWDNNPEGDIDVYAVYCDSAAGFKSGASTFVQFVSSPVTSLNLGAQEDTLYCRVSAVDTAGYAGGYSTETVAPPPPVPVAFQHVYAVADKDAVEIRWSVYADESHDGFNIYRRRDGQSLEIRLNTSGPIDPTENVYVDALVEPGVTYYYTVAFVLPDGTEQRSRTVEATVGVYTTRLDQNRPNPFNPTTTIRYQLSEDAAVTLAVYDLAGHLITRLVDEVLPAGVHTAVWDGTDHKGEQVSSGIYFYKLSMRGFSQTRKMVILK
jgi:hypothetical protein